MPTTCPTPGKCSISPPPSSPPRTRLRWKTQPPQFALGTDPNSGTDQAGLTLIPASGKSPHEFIYPQIAGGTGNIGTTYTAAGLRYVVEVSSDLTTWQSGPTVLTWSSRRETLPGGMERVGIHVIDPLLNSGSRVFTRLRVIPTN